MKVLDLFSGIGGFSLGLERAGMETIAFCEFDKHAQKVLKKHWPDVPLYDDVRTLDGKQFRGSVDVVCGGFPCQDLSVAGKAAGFSGERSSLYREMLRIISECLPGYAIFENVTGLLTGESGRWFAQFLYDLAQIGYDAEWHCIPASELGAHHHRDRVWIICYPNAQCSLERSKQECEHERAEINARVYEDVPNTNGLKQSGGIDEGKPERGSEASPERTESSSCGSCKQDMADTSGTRGEARLAGQKQREKGVERISINISNEIRRAKAGPGVEWWATEPQLGRVADGIPNRSHRLKQLGNAVVPQIPEIIGRAIMDYELSLI